MKIRRKIQLDNILETMEFKESNLEELKKFTNLNFTKEKLYYSPHSTNPLTFSLIKEGDYIVKLSNGTCSLLTKEEFKLYYCKLTLFGKLINWIQYKLDK